MAKGLLFSILIATILIPIVAASDPKPRRSLKKMVIGMLVFEFFWFMALVYVYGSLS